MQSYQFLTKKKHLIPLTCSNINYKELLSQEQTNFKIRIFPKNCLLNSL